MFPLYEIEDGVRYTLNHRGSARVTDSLKPRGRFRDLDAESIAHIQHQVDQAWARLQRQAARI
jgi:pyruvate ferredoxin oxidoreductase beta subunit/2-oxoisovalerate ferredoxin oxidoreductase beta subunit